jgi:transposase
MQKEDSRHKDWCASRKSPINACSIQSEYIISADKPFPNYHKQAKQLTEAKKEYPQLKTVHSQVLQQTLRTLDRAWDDMKANSADAGFGQFVNILEWVCFRSNVYFAKVDKNGTSQTCPNCGAHTGKKTLDIRIHNCHECGYITTRDVAASQEIRNRGVSAVLGSPQVEQLT